MTNLCYSYGINCSIDGGGHVDFVDKKRKSNQSEDDDNTLAKKQRAEELELAAAKLKAEEESELAAQKLKAQNELAAKKLKEEDAQNELAAKKLKEEDAQNELAAKKLKEEEVQNELAAKKLKEGAQNELATKKLVAVKETEARRLIAEEVASSEVDVVATELDTEDEDDEVSLSGCDKTLQKANNDDSVSLTQQAISSHLTYFHKCCYFIESILFKFARLHQY